MNLVVLNTNDSGFGSFRQAIIDADNNPGVDTITFNIPGSGVHTIAPSTELPWITDPTIIDGYTQPGSVKNTSTTGTNAVLNIEISGRNLGSGTNGLIIFGTTSMGTTFRGLIVNSFAGGTIETSGAGSGLINGSGFYLGVGANNVVEGCFIGTDATGTEARDNSIGVFLGDGLNRIGGTLPEQRNLISGNTGIGIGANSYSNYNTVVGNLMEEL
ncbi:MAG TPA: hypothetical protein VGN86_08970 [Pyrinomonadaceae bacterium]|jgi:hypothetical protein|nr:hypothetical protein [Pyrinomonadaceae bacterium]